MSADWKAGDRAVCVDNRPGTKSGHTGLILNRLYLVESIGMLPEGTIGLRVEDNGLWGQWRFRKLIPACDRAAIAAEAATP